MVLESVMTLRYGLHHLARGVEIADSVVEHKKSRIFEQMRKLIVCLVMDCQRIETAFFVSFSFDCPSLRIVAGVLSFSSW